MIFCDRAHPQAFPPPEGPIVPNAFLPKIARNNGCGSMSVKELFEISEEMKTLNADFIGSDDAKALQVLSDVVEAIGESWSGSWLGYHAHVYYAGLQAPPAGAHFSAEWGFKDMSFTGINGTEGEWREYEPGPLRDHILSEAGAPDLDAIEARARKAEERFNDAKSTVSSIFHTTNPSGADHYLAKLSEELEDTHSMSSGAILNVWKPSGQVMTRDSLAASQGMRAPVHLQLLARAAQVNHLFGVCLQLSKLCQKAASHIERQDKRAAAIERIGTNVFIGHGRSHVWRDLKDFLQDRLGLPWDEFNRVPVAGITNQSRLVEMLDSAAVAFIVMTAEDETADGEMQARMNVIHEVGLFQGRLGFTKAIVLLEEGCEEFSNIQGLGQIRFPAGNISAKFEDIRLVLEREGLISPKES